MSSMIQRYFNMLGLEATAAEEESFYTYLQELQVWNRKMNLTSILETEDIIIKHFYDSLLGMFVPEWNSSGRLLDMGTGAGFPGLPLKIMNQGLQVVLVDSMLKRVTFLQHLIGVLGIQNASVVHGRAEEIGQDKSHREMYDWVVSRAVARLSVLAEYCLPLLKTGGIFLAYKGPEGEAEAREAEKAIEIVGGALREKRTFSLPLERGQRTIIVITKVKATPAAFPRRPGLPQKKPL